MIALRLLDRGEPAFAAFEQSLADAGLPTDDLAEGARFFAVEENDDVLGYGGLEGRGADLLIRSVVVPSSRHGLGHGTAVAEALAELARADGAERLWLLTTSADRFFARLGWSAVDRATAPDTVRATRQFSGLCPAFAVLMCRRLA